MFQFGHYFFKFLFAFFKGFHELVFFLNNDRFYRFAIFLQFWIHFLQRFNRSINNFRQFRQIDFQFIQMTRHATKQSTQNVASVYIAWTTAIVNHHHARTQMFCHNSSTLDKILFLQIFQFFHHWRKKFDFKWRFDTLQQHCHSLQTKTSIDITLLQFGDFSIFSFAIFHKYIVPNFDIFSATTRWIAIFRTFWFACVIKHFGVWSARSLFAGNPPVIVFSEKINSFFWNTCFFPAFIRYFVTWCIIVTRKTGDRQFIRRNSQFFGQKFITHRDGLFFKIVSQ